MSVVKSSREVARPLGALATSHAINMFNSTFVWFVCSGLLGGPSTILVICKIFVYCILVHSVIFFVVCCLTIFVSSPCWGVRERFRASYAPLVGWDPVTLLQQAG